MKVEIEELVEFVKLSGYENVRVLEDETIVGTLDLLFTRAIFMGLDRTGWEKRFCFEDRSRADSEVMKLQTGDDEPTGWVARRGG
jgi:hypothetical protein